MTFSPSTASSKVYLEKLTTVDGETFCLFPLWTLGTANLSTPATCRGYNFLGWTTTSTGTNYITSYTPIEQLVGDVKTTTIYAQWSPIQYPITLDFRGGTGTQSSVIMQFDKTGDRNGYGVTPPTKEGYKFKGYYTGTFGTGTEYFDHNGAGVRPWKETNVTKLYACWERLPVVYPEITPTPAINPPAETSKIIEIYCTPAVKVSSTNPRYDAETSIPSTEDITINTTTGRYYFKGTVKDVSSKDILKVTVTVPYVFRYEDPVTEILYDENRTKTYTIDVERAYFWQELMNWEIKYPQSVTFDSDTLAHCVDTSSPLVFNFPQSTLHNIDDTLAGFTKKEHSITYTGTPILVHRFEAGIPTEAQLEEELMKTVWRHAFNFAHASDCQFGVRSDKFSLDGQDILKATTFSTGISNTYDATACAQAGINNKTILTNVSNSVPLNKYTTNGTKQLIADIDYEGM